eukprot:gene18550-19333_t
MGRLKQNTSTMSEHARLLPATGTMSEHVGLMPKLINGPTGSRINQGDGNSASELRKSSWTDSVLILVGAIMGSGTLGLPFALTKLGWYVGITVCVLFGLAAIYSGLLLGRVENKYCRGAESFSEAAKVLVGPKFEAFTRYGNLAVGEGVMCFYDWTLCIMAALIGMLQIRTLDSLSWMAGSSAMAIVAAMTLLLIDFAVFSPDGHNSTPHNSSSHLWPAKDTSFMDLYGSTATFVFAYQGQSIFFEIMPVYPQGAAAGSKGLADVLVSRCLRRSKPPVHAFETKDKEGRERFHLYEPETHVRREATLHEGSKMKSWYDMYSINLKFGYDCCSPKSISFGIQDVKMMRDLDNALHCARDA